MVKSSHWCSSVLAIILTYLAFIRKHRRGCLVRSPPQVGLLRHKTQIHLRRDPLWVRRRYRQLGPIRLHKRLMSQQHRLLSSNQILWGLLSSISSNQILWGLLSSNQILRRLLSPNLLRSHQILSWVDMFDHLGLLLTAENLFLVKSRMLRCNQCRLKSRPISLQPRSLR